MRRLVVRTTITSKLETSNYLLTKLNLFSLHAVQSHIDRASRVVPDDLSSLRARRTRYLLINGTFDLFSRELLVIRLAEVL